MQGGSFIIRVEKAKAGSSVPVGMVSAPIRDRAIIGRGPETDFKLADSTVAGEHILLETHPDGFSVRVLTDRGTTFINRDKVSAHSLTMILGNQAWLQIGRLLLSITLVMATLPFDDAISLPPEDTRAQPETPWLNLKLGEAGVQVWIQGQEVSLFPSAARVLVALCQSPGQVVAHNVLKQAMDPEALEQIGGNNLNQAATYIRNMFRQAIEESQSTNISEIKALMQACRSAPPLKDLETMDTRATLRMLIEGVRGVGYRLRLPSTSVSLVHGQNSQ